MNRPADAALPVSSNRRFLLDLSPIFPPGRSLTSLLIVMAPALTCPDDAVSPRRSRGR